MLEKVPIRTYVRTWTVAIVLALAFSSVLGYTAWTTSASNMNTYRKKAEEAMSINPKMTVTATVTGQKDNVLWSSMKAIAVSEATASSEYTGPSERNFAARNVIDFDPTMAWAEGVDGNGIGESITLDIGEERAVRAIQIRIGDCKDQESYKGSNRSKALKIKTETQTFETENFPDKNAELYIIFSESVKSSALTFEIKDVYEGTLDSTCISEISLFEMK